MRTTVAETAVVAAAAALARGLRTLLDLALAAPEIDHVLTDRGRFSGRVANLEGCTDVALLGGRLVLLHPSAPEVADDYAEPILVDSDRLRLEALPGFGSAGETVDQAWAADGTAAAVG